MQATRLPIEKRRKLSKPTECDDSIVVSVSRHFSQLSIKKLKRESGKMLHFYFREKGEKLKKKIEKVLAFTLFAISQINNDLRKLT